MLNESSTLYCCFNVLLSNATAAVFLLNATAKLLLLLLLPARTHHFPAVLQRRTHGLAAN
jgi:hypothetical protein